MSEKPNFVDGMRVSRHEKAPSFVIVNLGIKVDEFVLWLRKNQQGEWTNLDIKLSKNGHYYAELNTYQKGSRNVRDEVEENQGKLNKIGEDESEISSEDIPL